VKDGNITLDMKIKIKKLLSLLFIGSIGGLLGAFGGAENTTKGWRRLGIPLLITLSALCLLRNWWVLSIMSMAGVLSIGYGMPGFIPGWEDEGSKLGQFWYYRLLKRGYNATKTSFLANILTRATIGLLICISVVSIPILKGNWFVYILCSIGMIGSYATLSWRDLGTFKFKNKQLLWSEFIPFSIIVILAQVIVKL